MAQVSGTAAAPKKDLNYYRQIDSNPNQGQRNNFIKQMLSQLLQTNSQARLKATMQRGRGGSQA